jgi:hypothetical protein
LLYQNMPAIIRFNCIFHAMIRKSSPVNFQESRRVVRSGKGAGGKQPVSIALRNPERSTPG